MVFWEQKTELACFLSIIEETKVIINAVDDDAWESEYEGTGSFIEGVESWHWLCLYIWPMAFPIMNAIFKWK